MAITTIWVSVAYPLVFISLTELSEAIWQLVGLSRWLIDLLERIARQCIYVGDLDVPTSKAVPTAAAYDAEIDAACESLCYPRPSSCSKCTASIFVHLLHPFALRNLHEAVGHVRRFRNELDPLPPKGENAQIAKEVLMDTVNSAGIHLDAFFSLLEEIKTAVKLSGP